MVVRQRSQVRGQEPKNNLKDIGITQARKIRVGGPTLAMSKMLDNTHVCNRVKA